MKFHKESGWWLPDREVHLADWLHGRENRIDGRLLYQRAKYIHTVAAMGRGQSRRRVAVDVGAHVGMWSWQMAHHFKQVVAFEPVKDFGDCWKKNMRNMVHKAVLHRAALGEAEVHVGFRVEEAHTMRTRVDPESLTTVKVRTLDSYRLEHVSMLKIDCEGYEGFIIRGALKTIERWHPIIVVEQKDGNAEAYGLPAKGAVDQLQALGYEVVEEMAGDYIMRYAP